MRCGASSSTTARVSWPQGFHRLLALAALGRQEAEEHEGTVLRLQPAARSGCAVTLLAPGSGTTGRPAARTAATSRAPGSLMPGVPASLA